MDGHDGYEPHSHYTPNAGYESGSSAFHVPEQNTRAHHIRTVPSKSRIGAGKAAHRTDSHKRNGPITPHGGGPCEHYTCSSGCGVRRAGGGGAVPSPPASRMVEARR